MVPCDICKGEKTIISRWTMETGGKKIRCPGCMGRGEVPLSVIRAKQKRRLEESRAAQDSPPEPSEPQNPSENPQPMPLTDRDYYRGKHPAACTCAECDRRRLGNQGRETQRGEEQAPMYCAKHRRTPTNVRCGSCDTPICPDCLVFGPLGQRCRDGCRNPKPYRRPSVKQPAQTTAPASPAPRSVRRRSNEQTRAISRRTKRRGFWGWIKWPAAGLLVLAMLATVAAMGYHGGSLPSAFTMTTDDYRLLAACPTEVEAFWEFFRRPADDDYVSMSDRYGDDWTEQICNASASQQQSMPTPDTQAMVQAAIEATVQAVTAADTTPPLAAAATPSPTPDTQAMVQAAIEATVQAVISSDTTPLPASAPAPPPTAAPTNTPLPTPTPTSTPLPTATPTNTPTPTATAVVHPSERHIELKRYMLDLINDERSRTGVDPVVLGDNIAAQLHAESSLDNCFSSHWGVDGLKPYMRYSLAGGQQSNGENGSGLDYCIPASGRVGTILYRAIGSIEREVRDTMEGWMRSPGHRRNILDPWHKKVNIGLAWDRYNLFAYQHFEGDYVEYGQIPAIENGILTMSGTVKNGAGFGSERDLGVQVYYDQPPHTLTPGQVSRTYCYDGGLLISALRAPLTGNWYYDEDEFTWTHDKCPDPYEVPANALAPRSPDEAHAFWEAAYRASQLLPSAPIVVPWITAFEWGTSAHAFFVRADLSNLLSRHGGGVYSIIVWGVIAGERVVISEYSIFYGVTPPDTYDPGRYD